MNSRESCCTPGRLSTATSVARANTSCANSSRSGAIAPTAFRWAPLSSMPAVRKGSAARVTSVTIWAPLQASATEAQATASTPSSSRTFTANASRDSLRGLCTCSRSIGRTASIVPTCASACLPVPTMAITRASCLAIQSAATPEMPPVRRLPRAKASITATSDPSSALQRSRSGQVPPWVCVQVLVPTSWSSLPPIACRLFFPYCSRVFVMFCASPRASARSAASRAAIASLRSISWTTSASAIQIASVVISDLERSEYLVGKQLFELEAPVADALLESEIDEGLQRLAVLLQAVRPEVLAKEALHSLSVGRKPGERRVRGGDVGEPLHGAVLGFLEGLVEIHREPGVALQHIGLDDDHVHYGKDPGLLEIRRFDLLVVRKQAPDSAAEGARRPRREHGVDVPGEQHIVERALGFGAEPHAFGRLEPYFLYASRFVHDRLVQL